jgi:hypothetical protein
LAGHSTSRVDGNIRSNLDRLRMSFAALRRPAECPRERGAAGFHVEGGGSRPNEPGARGGPPGPELYLSETFKPRAALRISQIGHLIGEQTQDPPALRLVGAGREQFAVEFDVLLADEFFQIVGQHYAAFVHHGHASFLDRYQHLTISNVISK